MTAPRLSRKLVLEVPEHVPDGAGGFTEGWAVRGLLWAELKAGSGREVAGDAAPISASSYRITVRAAPHGAPSRPEPNHRFREGARIFKILAVSERDPGARYLTCFAREESSA